MEFKSILQQQQDFFATGTTLSLDFRIEQLKKIKQLITSHESSLTAALKKDLNKSTMEAMVTEILLVIDEIDLIIKNLRKWARPKKVPSPFPFFWPGKSYLYHEPYGSAFIMGPWNYPFLLVMSPLIGAICAGNCAIIKPSEIAPHTQDVIVDLINTNFPAEYIYAVKAGPTETEQLLQEQFDYIFFTGGTQTGKKVMRAAADHLTPVTLELGGKSPCIVDETADLNFAARRIVWGKFMNAGQTCIAPDYLYVHQSCKNALVEKLQATIKKFYGADPEVSKSYGKIINQAHLTRLMQLMKNGRVICGGKINIETRYFSPTLIDDISWHDPIMQEEIFGPLLPIMTFDKLEDVIQNIKSHPKPLALYLFTKNNLTETTILNQVSFGGGCVNDCVLQVANPHLPFGGVGQSGMGSYHGKFSFETFSHCKSVYKKTRAVDFNLQYPPYTRMKLWLLKRLA